MSRCRFQAALALVSAGGGLALAAPAASADQTVVSATIYSGSQGGVAAKAATLSQLQTCQPYSGPNPLYLYPGQQPFQAPPDSTWTVSEVLQCALGISPSQLSDVQVGTVNRGFEAPLSSAALTDASQYQDPAAQGALPIISSDGAEDQNTYVRPWRGGSDSNATDQVVQSGEPVALLVYLNGSLLTVTATQQTVSHTSTTRSIALTGAVRDASGAVVPASELTWNWSFGDGTSSPVASPTHTFTPGAYYVTVAVTDNATGSGGTATLPVTFNAPASTGAGNHNGTPKRTKSKNPSGSDHGSPAPTSGADHQKRSRSPTTTTQTTTTQSTTTPAASTTTPTTTATTPTATTTTTTTATQTTITATRPRRRPARRTRTRPQPAIPRSAPLVSGQLVSAVTPLPATSSPLVHFTPAAATPPTEVRQASRISTAPAVGGALAVGLLLALGAGRELRGRQRWKLDDGGN